MKSIDCCSLSPKWWSENAYLESAIITDKNRDPNSNFTTTIGLIFFILEGGPLQQPTKDFIPSIGFLMGLKCQETLLKAEELRIHTEIFPKHPTWFLPSRSQFATSYLYMPILQKKLSTLFLAWKPRQSGTAKTALNRKIFRISNSNVIETSSFFPPPRSETTAFYSKRTFFDKQSIVLFLYVRMRRVRNY